MRKAFHQRRHAKLKSSSCKNLSQNRTGAILGCGLQAWSLPAVWLSDQATRSVGCQHRLKPVTVHLVAGLGMVPRRHTTISVFRPCACQLDESRLTSIQLHYGLFALVANLAAARVRLYVFQKQRDTLSRTRTWSLPVKLDRPL